MRYKYVRVKDYGHKHQNKYKRFNKGNKYNKDKNYKKSDEDKAVSEGINFMMKGISLFIEFLFKLIFAIFTGIVNAFKKMMKNKKGDKEDG